MLGEATAAIIIGENPQAKQQLDEALMSFTNAFIYVRACGVEKLTATEHMRLVELLGPLGGHLTAICMRLVNE